MRKIISSFLILCGVNLFFMSTLGLMSEMNIYSYVLGICAMSVTDILMDWRYR